MVNLSPIRENLIKQQAKWLNQPSVAIRVPQRFAQQILDWAASLDRGDVDSAGNASGGNLDLEAVCQWIQELDDLDRLRHLKTKIDRVWAEVKERKCDRRMEQAILDLAQHCDGARDRDGLGFNKIDASYGQWLKRRIEAKQPILKAHARSALKMLQKYAKQLEQSGLTLPQWDEIDLQYPDRVAVEEEQQLPEKRIEPIGVQIAVYAPYDSTGSFQRKAKRIEGYKFEGSDKSWRYPLSQIEEIMESFPNSEYHYDSNIEGAIALNQVRKAEEEVQKAEEAARLEAEALEKSGGIIKLVQAADLDAPLANGWHLRDYQKRGVEWLLARGRNGIYRGGILADHMGLGKSLVSLVAARAMQRTLDCAVFIVSPVSLLENWRREAERAQVAIEIFSWAKIPKPLESQKYVLIADESHYAQNEKSQRTQKLLELVQHDNCLAAWLLTGTPIKNGRPINLYPLLLAIDHPLTKDRWSYHYRYCNAHKKSIGRGKTVWDVSGASHLDELAQKTEDAILRRTKQECLTELPAKTRLFKPAELAPSQAKEYDVEIRKLVKDYKERAKRGEVDLGAEALVTLNILRKVGSQYKVEAAIALAEELLEQGQQVVLFTEFLESANAAYAALSGELLTGKSPTQERQAMVDRFQSGESKVFTGTIKAGGVGITLTAASHVILVDRPWTPGDCEQAEDRCHRLGQSNAVFSTWLQLGQIDRAIDELLASKQQRIELVLKGKRKTLSGLDSPKELAKQLLEIL